MLSRKLILPSIATLLFFNGHLIADERISSESQFMLAPCNITPLQPTFAAYNTFPINAHSLRSIGDGYRSLELEDGSHWEVPPSDVYVLQGWKREDSLVITPNYS